MLKNVLDRRILLIAFILMIFIAIPSSFAGDSSAIDYAASPSDVGAVDAVDSIDDIDSISVESNVDDDKQLNDEASGVDDSTSDKNAAALGASQLGDGASWSIDGSSTTYSSLSEAIDAATDGAKIVGAPGTEETISSTLKISKNVDIIAANSGDVVLKGSTNSVLNISEGYKVNLVNIAFKDYSIPGSTNIRGGAIYNNGTMSITSCTFENITISGSYGYAPAIYNYGNMVINDCVFDSLTGYYGAPIYSYYSGPYGNYKRSNITVANSTFRKISSNQVGVLYLYQNGKNEVVNCTFEDLDLKHAVIHINTVNATIENCTFKNINVTSTSSSDYAAVLQSQQTGNNITFAGNYIDGVNFSGSTTSNGGTCLVLSRGTVGGAGRADIYNNIIVNSKVTNNAADSTYSYVGSSLINSANGNVNYNIFANNEVSGLTGKTYDVLAFGSVDANYNYWGSNEGPNSTSHSSNITVDYWTTLNVEIPDSIFIGSSEEIIFKLQAMNSAGTASDLPDASGTIALPISSVLNDVPSEVIINKGTGSFTYEADESGDETLTLATGDSYPFEVSADASSLIYVDDVAGTADGPGDANHPYKTIAQALNVATNGKTIIIRSGTYKEHTLSVNVDVEIRADKDAEVIIDAEKLGRVFIIDADVSLRDLTLINGESTAFGGAIFLSGGNLTANRINIYNSTAGSGGAIATWSTASSLNITNSKFVDNSINPNAYGAYTNGGGAIYSDIPNTFIMDSVFTNNKANIIGGSQGGAIYLADDGIIANNEFNENSATYDSQGFGGAIYAENADNNVTIANNVFSANNADEGGAIYIDSPAETNIIGNTFTNNGADLCGGAVYVEDTKGIISDNAFNGNSASDANNGKGGSIYIESSNITLSGNTISASAAKVGSKIFVNGDSNLVGTTTTFLSNVTVGLEKGDSIDITAIATDDKGNVIVGGSIEFIVGAENLGSVPVSTDDPVVKTYTIAEDAENDLLVTGSYSLDEGSTIKTAVLHPCVLHWFIEGKDGGYEFLSDAVAAAESGDVIYGLSDTYDISTIEINKDVTIKANNTGDIILNIVSGKFARISNGAVVKLKNLIIQNGKSTLGAAVQVSSSTLNVENCIFKDANYSVSTYDTYGGYIYALRSNVNIIDSAFTKINASGTYAYGGAIYASGCNLNIINSNFTDLVSSNGGAIYSYTTNLTVDNSTFDNVSSTGTSGAISINMNSNVTINNSLFENNYASTSGGALYASGGKLNVNNTVFVNNRANSASSYGAAIYTSIDGNITYCVFINNTEGRPTPVGSDIYLSSSSRVLNIDYCYFGTNEKPTNASVSNYALTNLHNWAILDLSIDHVPVQGSTATVTIELSKYTDGEETSSLESFLPGLTFDISALIGSVEPAYVTLDDENSAKATIEYNALSIGPEVIAASLLGNEVANLTFDVTPDSATTIFVSAEGSDVDGTGSELSPYATIERALSDVNEVKNVIYVKEGTYTEHNINVNKNVSIIGENDNVIIDAEGNSIIFNIAKDLDVILDRLSLTNATAASGEGVIKTKSSVVLNNIVIGDDVEGTIIYNDGAKFNTTVTFIEGSVQKSLKGTEVTINATVTDTNGFSIAGGIVEFTLNGISNGTAVLGDNGVATYTLTLSDDYVDYVVSGNYSGSDEETVVTGLLRAIQYNWFINDNTVGYETLAEAVEAAEDGDVITGLPGTYTANGIKIDKQITIKANESDSIILDGDGKQIFNISSKVDLINLTLENGITTAPGGLINLTSSQADLSIIDCTLRDSLSTANGGAINVVYGKLNIINSKFSNISARIGGIIYHNTNFAEINIVNSSFDNIKTTSDGTVLYSCGNVTVIGSNFTNIQGSTSSADYGVIYIKTPGNLTVTESVFANINGPGGAAIYHVGSGAINVTRNIFTNITALTKGSIYSSGTTSQSYVNYNVFLNNNMDINASSTSVKLNADYNYFGSNDQPTAKNINFNSLYTYWAILDVSLNDTSAIVGNDYTLSVALVNYTDGTANYTLETPLPEFDIDLSALLGTVEPKTLTVSNEVATATYIAVAAGDEIITVGPETIELNVVFDGDYALVSNVSEINIDLNEPVVISISVLNANGALSEDLNGETVTVTYNVGGETYTATATVDGSTILFNTSALTALESGITTQAEFNIVKEGKTILPLDITINVEKLYTALTCVDTVSINVGSGSVDVTIKDELGNALAGKTIVLAIGDDISLSAVSGDDGVATIDLSSLAYGNYEATISFAGDEAYIGSSCGISINVEKSASSLSLVREGDNIVATLTSGDNPIAGKTLSAVINGETVTAVTDANGIAKFDISALSPNNYTIEVSFTDDAYADASESIDVEIPKYPTAINATDITVVVGSGTLDVVLTSEGVPVEGKTIIATFNGVEITAVTDANGIASIDLSSLEVNTYDAEIKFAGDDSYEASDANVVVTVKEASKTSEELQKLIDETPEGGVLDLSNTLFEGISDINITKDITIVGDNTTIVTAGDGKPIFNVGSDVENVTISGLDIKANNADVIVKVTATNGTDPLSIETPAIEISNNTISTASDDVVAESITVLELESERGVLAPNNPIVVSGNTLDAGINPFDFDVTSISSGSDVNIPSGPISKDRIETQIIYENMSTTAVDVDTDGRVGEYFYITLKDKNNNLLANKPVQIGFNGQVYDRVTDDKGQARLQINLKNAGTYTFAVSYLGDDEYNGSFIVAKIVVSKQKGSLTVPNKSYKASASSKTLTATFKSASGKVVSGKKITFTVNGKSYSATTNDKGVATVKVSLNTKGTYSFTAKFAGNTMYAAISKTAKLTIT